MAKHPEVGEIYGEAVARLTSKYWELEQLELLPAKYRRQITPIYYAMSMSLFTNGVPFEDTLIKITDKHIETAASFMHPRIGIIDALQKFDSFGMSPVVYSAGVAPVARAALNKFGVPNNIEVIGNEIGYEGNQLITHENKYGSHINDLSKGRELAIIVGNHPNDALMAKDIPWMDVERILTVGFFPESGNAYGYRLENYMGHFDIVIQSDSGSANFKSIVQSII